MPTVEKRDRVRELTDVPFPSLDAPVNDEAFAMHPLAERGLRPCGAFEVENSSWVRGLDMRNRGHPHHDPLLFQHLRHWVWTFHDSVLECAALSYAALELRDRPDDRLSRMHELLRSP